MNSTVVLRESYDSVEIAIQLENLLPDQTKARHTRCSYPLKLSRVFPIIAPPPPA